MESSIDQIIDSYRGHGRDSLIPILQEIQEKQGFLSELAIVKTGEVLKIPTSKIFGVATFYNQFRFEPKGTYHVQICRGTACHVLGSSTVLSEIEKHLKIKAGQTTRDGMFSIEVVACIGACGLAPVVTVNGEFHAKVTAASLKNILDSYKVQEEV
jgi:NADH-quinone oxidoreductase E subunit